MQPTMFHQGTHVNLEDVYDARNRCPVCLSQHERRARLRIQNDPAIDMLLCENCGACSASHMPKPELLDRYYARYYSNSTDHIAFNNPGRFAQHLSAVLKPQPVKSLRILDFGGGDG